MKNKYKVNEILDAVNVILNQKNNITDILTSCFITTETL